MRGLPGRPDTKPAAHKPWLHTDLQVTGMTIDEQMSKFGLTHVFWVKTDTEGYDASVLRGAVDALSNKRIELLQFECVHGLYVGQCLRICSVWVCALEHAHERMPV
jgi:hypothetical protein